MWLLFAPLASLLSVIAVAGIIFTFCCIQFAPYEPGFYSPKAYSLFFVRIARSFQTACLIQLYIGCQMMDICHNVFLSFTLLGSF